MTEEAAVPADPRDLLSLKLLEAEVSSDDPWGDDKLGREEIARRLTNIVSRQTSPFVISLHGAWGTGKTFILKRWQRDLEKQGFNAIYFNAWEDDFCDDPLLAIIGQLSDYFKDSGLKAKALEIAKIAIPLLGRNIKNVLQHGTGTTFDTSGLESRQRKLLEEYFDQRKTKDELKQGLSELADEVVKETQQPLVFIIDELDRCRPSFTIELLERVKHIFDVPNVVFVLGINRDELSKSLKSVYGDIDADTYLRRFIDLPLLLPTIDSRDFTKHLFDRHGLTSYLESGEMRSTLPAPYVNHIPGIWTLLSLTLRDIQQCVLLSVLVAKSRAMEQNMHPYLLGILIPLKVKEPAVFKDYVDGSCTGARVMDWVDQYRQNDLDPELDRVLEVCEATLYAVDNRFDTPSLRGEITAKPPALEQLDLLDNEDDLTRPEFLSERLRAGKVSVPRIRTLMKHYERSGGVVREVSELIDFHHETIRL